jgi:predicted component of type VI protein secretion system
MNWKKIICATLLAGAVMAAAVGCQAASTIATTTTQPTDQASATTQPAASTAPSTVKPTQPNGTMSQPPSGNFTGERPGSQTMDLTAAATKLGVTIQQLTDALGNTQQGMADFTTIATKLGVTEQALREALGINSANGTMPGGAQPPTTSPTTTSK